MFVEQEYKVEKKQRRAFCDVCTSAFRIIVLLISALFALFMAYYAKSAVVSLACCIVALIPCVHTIIDQFRTAKLGTKRNVWHFSLTDQNAVRHMADGRTIAFPYKTLRVMQENESFFMVASKTNAVVLKKNELSAETLNELVSAIKAENPRVRRKTVRYRSLLCAVLTAVTAGLALAYTVVCLSPIVNGFAFAPRASDVAVAHFTEVHSISQVGCRTLSAYISEDEKAQMLYVYNTEYETYSPELYYISFSNRDWQVREVTSADVRLEFRTDTVRVRVIHIEDCCVLEIRGDVGLQPRTENLTPNRWWHNLEVYDGEYQMIMSRSCPDGIQKDAILYLGDEAYPVGKMLSE